MTGTNLKLLISLHDATPFHQARLEKAEALFRDLGLTKVTYLFVPQYHGGHLSSGSSVFVDWCRASRPFQVQWHLHGYHHLEDPHSKGGQGATRAGDKWKRRYLTAGEGEFLALDDEEMRAKIEAGREVFRACLQAEPQGFVAPAWLFNSAFPDVLKTQGIRYTEDHGRIYDLDSGGTITSPVITWATRTILRKYGSLVVCPLMARFWATTPVLRVALHPFDFDHAVTVANIRGVLRRLLDSRTQVFCDEVKYRA